LENTVLHDGPATHQRTNDTNDTNDANDTNDTNCCVTC